MRRLTAAAGLAWLVLFAVGGVLLQGEPPGTGEPAGDIRAYLDDRGTAYLIGDHVAGLAFVGGLTVFAVGLAMLVRRAHPDDEPARLWAWLTVVGVTLTVATGDAATAYLDALALSGPALPDATVHAFVSANAAGIAAIGLPMALLSLSLGMVTRALQMPHPVAWLGWLAAALHAVGGLFLLGGPLGSVLFAVRFGGLITFGVLVLTVSVLLLRQAHAERVGDPATALGGVR